MGALTAVLSLPDIQSSVPEDKIYGIGGLLEPSARTAVEYGKAVISTSNITSFDTGEDQRHLIFPIITRQMVG